MSWQDCPSYPTGTGVVDEKVRQLMAQINVLEDELRASVHQAEVRLFYRVDGKRIIFDKSVRRHTSNRRPDSCTG